MKTKILKDIQKLTDDNIKNIENILTDKEKRLAKYEQIKPCCLYHGRQW